jgi:hypothetical protein
MQPGDRVDLQATSSDEEIDMEFSGISSDGTSKI